MPNNQTPFSLCPIVLLASLIMIMLIGNAQAGEQKASEQNRQQVLHLLTWPDYMDDAIIKAFEALHNVSINFSHFESEEHRERLLSQGQNHIDLVLLSEPFLPIYSALGWIDRLDPEKLPAKRHIDPRWRAQTHGVGYMWGVTGLAYRKDKVPVAPNSWTLFHAPGDLKGDVALYDDPMEVTTAFAIAGQFELAHLTPVDLTEVV